MRHIWLTCVAMLAATGTSFATTINVPADYTTIQAAVAAASNGDEILVAPGTYTGTGAEVVDMLGKAITIKASGTPEETILDGEGARRVVECSSGEGADAVIEGFTITGGSADYGGGIYCYGSSSPTITGCTISDNTSGSAGGGIYCGWGSPTITGCTITDNTASSYGGGISCSVVSTTISGCTISNNTSDYGGGIYCWGSTTLTDTVVCENAPDNIYGPWTDGGGGCIAYSCQDSDGNGVPDKCDGSIGDGIHEVPSEYATVQEAINAAGYGDTVLVAPGTYTGTGDWVINTGGKPITILATGTTEETILDGEGARLVVQCAGGEGAGTIIEGFTITNGNTFHGGGIYCNNSSPTITDCTILGNFAFNDYGGGGGIYCNNSSPTITDCTISDNNSTYQGAGIACISSNPIITGCTISGNVSGYHGGGIWCWGGSPTITDCTISNNTATVEGGGIRFDGGNGSPTLTDTLVCGNDPDQVFGYFVDGGENTILDQCPDLPGACCNGEDCSITTEAGCNGDWLGEGTDCSGNPCYVPPTGACCNGEDCSITTEAGCNGDWLGEGTDCSGNPCYVPPTGACCNGEDCSITTEAGCNGDWLGEGTDCSGNPCYVPPTGACCNGEDCSITTEAGCNGDWLGEGTDCSGNPCYVPPTGACCINGSCAVTTEADCSGDWLGEATDCSGNKCYVPPTGACCIGNNCSITTQTDCNNQGGDYQGDSTNCENDPCDIPPPMGACCTGNDCAVTTEAKCSGEWLGNGSTCNPTACINGPSVPLCLDHELYYTSENLITERLYAKIPEGAKLLGISGTQSNPLNINLEYGHFFQHDLGGPLSLNINSEFFHVYPDLEWDSYLTIGSLYADGTPFPSNELNSIGIYWDNFESGNSLSSDNGMIWVTPGDYQGQPIDGIVFIGQLSFVTNEPFYASFGGNFHWQDADGNIWYEFREIEFSDMLDECNDFGPDCGPEEPPCLGDLTGDGSIKVHDLLSLLEAWGSYCYSDCGCPECPCYGDLNGNMSVEIGDLHLMIQLYGTECP